MSSADIHLLCTEYISQGDIGNVAAGLGTAGSVLDQLKCAVPAPFSTLIKVCSVAVSLAEKTARNSSECYKLARRLTYYNVLIVDLSVTGSTAAVHVCTEQLIEEFTKAVDFLTKMCITSKMSQLDILKVRAISLTANLAEKFKVIYDDIMHVMSAANLGLSLQAIGKAPTLGEIQASVCEEMCQVSAELERMHQETGENLSSIQSDLHKLIQLTAAKETVVEPRMFEQDEVVIYTGKMLGVGGAYGTVYRGTLHGTIDVAVKVLSPSICGKDEVRRAMRVQHNNVVKAYGLIIIGTQQQGVVMELLGTQLDMAIKEGSMTNALRMKLTMDIIAGMAHMHTHSKVVHFDLKPANILLTLDGRRAKIADFGVSQTYSTMSSNAGGTYRGTLPYMAPEILKSGANMLTNKCDVYSFGVVLYELWTGKVAWEGISADYVSVSVLGGSRPATRSDLSALGVPLPIVYLIEACWRDDPHYRPTFKYLHDNIPDAFCTSPREHWPKFQEVHETGPSSPLTDSKVREFFKDLPDTTTFTRLSNQQLESVLLAQGVHPTVVEWIKGNVPNGKLIAKKETILQRLRHEAMIDEFHIDGLQTVIQTVLCTTYMNQAYDSNLVAVLMAARNVLDDVAAIAHDMYRSILNITSTIVTLAESSSRNQKDCQSLAAGITFIAVSLIHTSASQKVVDIFVPIIYQADELLRIYTTSANTALVSSLFSMACVALHEELSKAIVDTNMTDSFHPITNKH